MNKSIFIRYSLHIADNNVIEFDNNNFVITNLSSIEKSVFCEPKKMLIDISMNLASLESIVENFSSTDVDRNIFSLCDKSIKLCFKISENGDFASSQDYILFS